MASRTGEVPGLAVFMATAGGFLLYIGIKNVPLLDGLRSMLKGKVPTPRPKKVVEVPGSLTPGGGGGGGAGAAPSSARGAQIAAAAMKYRGEPYSWGGAVPTSAGGPGLDCSGFVTWVLHHDLGIELPSNTHTVTQVFHDWNAGSTVVPFDQAAAGDLVCWEQHMGIALGAGQMVHAPTAGDVVKVGNIWTSPEMPVIRRVK